jgi:hypothetical protein
MPNRSTANNRAYLRQILKKAMDRYITKEVKSGRAVGHQGKPEGIAIDLDEMSHRIADIRQDRDIWTSKAIVLNSPLGDITDSPSFADAFVQGIMKGKSGR